MQINAIMKKRILLLLAVVFLCSAFQAFKTTLTVTVRDDLGNLVEGATIQLFETEDDYTKEENVAAEGVTDKKGISKFKDLKPIPYFIIVRTEEKDNAGGGEKIEKLDEKKVNKVTIIIQ